MPATPSSGSPVAPVHHRGSEGPDGGSRVLPGPILHHGGENRENAWIIPAIIGAVVVAAVLLGSARMATVAGTFLQLLFLAFFIRHLTFAAAALSSAGADLDAPLLDNGHRPSVSVLVACKNEEAVVANLTTSLLALDYPPDLIQLIVVNDGSTDHTGAILDEAAARDSRLHPLHRRPGAGGGKSGALNEGLSSATGEIVIIFDADHRPRPDVVRRHVRHFSDPAVGAVQGRCEIANGGDSPLATLVAVDYLAGYLVNEYGRQAVFHLPAYGGANCAVRATMLRSLGGWNPRSVTEDTDLTLRLLLSGARVRYDVTAVDEEEGVVTFDHYWSQRYRWARGHQQVWRDYRRAVWRSERLTRSEKLETTMFLYAFHLPVLSMLGMLFLLAWFGGIVTPVGSSWLFVFTTLLFLGPLTEVGGGLILARADRRLALSLVWFLPLFFVSMAVSAKAWIDGIAGRPYAWVKTQRAADGWDPAVPPDSRVPLAAPSGTSTLLPAPTRTSQGGTR